MMRMLYATFHTLTPLTGKENNTDEIHRLHS